MNSEPSKPTAWLKFLQLKWILILAACAFGASLAFPFIALDDAKHIWQNPYVVTLNFQNLKQFWLEPYYGLYIPLVYNLWSLLAAITQSLGLKHEISGFSAPLFHLAVVVSHLLNVFLAWNLVGVLFSRSGQRDETGLARALAVLPFAIHPLQTEAVAWVSGFKDTLSANFMLLASLAFFSSLPQSKRVTLDNFEWLRHYPKIYFLLFAAAALLSKPVAVILPFVLLVWILIIEPSQLKRTKIFIPVLLMAGWIIWITKISQPDTRLEFELQLWERPLVAFASLGFYLGKMLLPFPLTPDYGLTPPLLLKSPLVSFYYIFAFAFFTLLLWAMFWSLKQRKDTTVVWRILVLGALWIALGFAPALGLVPFEFQNLSTVADRYFYLFPALGLGLMMTSVNQFATKNNNKYLLFSSLAMVWLALSSLQTSYWSSNDRLFNHAARVNPQSYLAYNNLGLQSLRRNDFADAEFRFRQALKTKPDYLAAIANLGVVYFRKKDYPATIQYYQKALAGLPQAGAGSPATFSDMHFNLGAAFLNSQNVPAGVENLERAVQINPDHFMAQFHLGRAYALLGRKKNARAQLQQALRLQPDDPRVLSELNKLRELLR